MDFETIKRELKFKSVRSSGAGGQHVNKVSSKVELTFDLASSNALTDEEKQLLFKNLSSKLTKDKLLIIFCDESRSQHKNKKLVIERLFELLKKNSKKPKKRRATKPTKSSIKKRLDTKKKLSEKKSSRKKPNLN